ncbi:LiaF transmembrane domain-containing protein [Gottfriedia solisilvae]|uniref:LiaF transmembrane domain-containing protein n=1 Tax=Gottfriedia solisilvae TaxID=1516104 RepID=UPI003D2EC8B7
MKKNRLFIGILLIGFGLYYFISKWHVPSLNIFTYWTTPILITGIALLVQAFKGKETHYVFPGFIVLGFGIHFYAISHVDSWPNHWSVLTLIISIGMLFQSQRGKGDLLPGILLFIMSLFFLFNEKLTTMLSSLQSQVSYFQQYWPVLIALIGLYLLFSKK